MPIVKEIQYRVHKKLAMRSHSRLFTYVFYRHFKVTEAKFLASNVIYTFAGNQHESKVWFCNNR